MLIVRFKDVIFKALVVVEQMQDHSRRKITAGFRILVFLDFLPAKINKFVGLVFRDAVFGLLDF